MAMTPEGKVKKQVKRVLDLHPHAWYYMPANNGYGRSGIPDFIGCCKGYFFSVETKANGKDLTTLQKLENDKIRRAEGCAFVVQERDGVLEGLDALVAFLEKLTYEVV